MFRIEDDQLKLWDVIGRSVVVHAGKQEVEKASDSRSAFQNIFNWYGIQCNGKKKCWKKKKQNKTFCLLWLLLFKNKMKNKIKNTKWCKLQAFLVRHGNIIIVFYCNSIFFLVSFFRLACGIIARSAGLFQNSKRICACDGVVVWDERDVPVAGAGRQNREKTPTANLWTDTT